LIYQSYLNEEVSSTEPSLSVIIRWYDAQIKSVFSGGFL
jgi:hypothetical protein